MTSRAIAASCRSPSTSRWSSREPMRQLRARRRSTSSIASEHYGSSMVKYLVGRGPPRFHSCSTRRGCTARINCSARSTCRTRSTGFWQVLRAGRPAQQAHPPPRPQRLREVDVHPLASAAASSTTRRSTRARSLSVLVDLPGAEARPRRHRLWRRSQSCARFQGVVRVPARRRDRRARGSPTKPPRSPAAAGPARRAPEADRAAYRRSWSPAAPSSTSATTCARARCRRRTRAIYDALLASYQGDYAMVLRHVRVERFEVSHRYRGQAWVTVEPQLSLVDATRAPGHPRSHARLAAAVAPVGLAARVRRRGRRREPRHHRVRRSVEAPARALQVPPDDRRARRTLDDERDAVPRSRVPRELQRYPPPRRVPRDPRFPELQGPHRAGPRALHPRRPPRGAALPRVAARGRGRAPRLAAGRRVRRRAVGRPVAHAQAAGSSRYPSTLAEADREAGRRSTRSSLYATGQGAA